MLIVLMFSLSLIPYIMFALNNPGALTRRFGSITYLFRSSVPAFEKIILFVKNYCSYAGPDFLLLKGDRNLTHATGYGGEVFIVVFVLCVVGLVWLMSRKQIPKDKFALLIFLNLLLSPCAGSLTTGKTNAVRSILVGLYILVFSCYGFAFLLRTKGGIRRGILIGIVFVALLAQSCLYLTDYFTNYGKKSIVWFETYGFKDALAAAIAQRPERIVVQRTKQAYVCHVCVAFYENLIPNPHQIPIYVRKATPENNICIIYFEGSDHDLRMYPYKFEAAGTGDELVRLRCY